MSRIIFETDPWIDTLVRSYGYTKHSVGRGSLFLHVKSRVFGNRLISLPFSDYGKPGSSSSEELAELLEEVKAEYAEVRVPEWKRETIEYLKEAGFEEVVSYKTFLLRIDKPAEFLWTQLNKKVRNSVRYAVKKGVKVKRVESLDDLKGFYSLYLRGARELGSPPHTFKFYKTLKNSLGDRLLIDVALLGETLIGGIVVLAGDRWANFWQNIALRKYRRFNASYLLLWNIIEELSAINFEIFDFGRTREGTGVYFFKKKWGGEEKKIYHMAYSLKRRVNPPDPHQRKYLLLSRLWRKIPLKATEIIGSRLIGGIAL